MRRTVLRVDLKKRKITTTLFFTVGRGWRSYVVMIKDGRDMEYRYSAFVCTSVISRASPSGLCDRGGGGVVMWCMRLICTL